MDDSTQQGQDVKSDAVKGVSAIDHEAAKAKVYIREEWARSKLYAQHLEGILTAQKDRNRADIAMVNGTNKLWAITLLTETAAIIAFLALLAVKIGLL